MPFSTLHPGYAHGGRYLERAELDSTARERCQRRRDGPPAPRVTTATIPGSGTDFLDAANRKATAACAGFPFFRWALRAWKPASHSVFRRGWLPRRTAHTRQAACHAALRHRLRKMRRNSEGPPIGDLTLCRKVKKLRCLAKNVTRRSHFACRLRDDPEKNYPPDSRGLTAEVGLPLAGVRSGLIEN